MRLLQTSAIEVRHLVVLDSQCWSNFSKASPRLEKSATAAAICCNLRFGNKGLTKRGSTCLGLPEFMPFSNSPPGSKLEDTDTFVSF